MGRKTGVLSGVLERQVWRAYSSQAINDAGGGAHIPEVINLVAG